jgi:hypothetical protein
MISGRIRRVAVVFFVVVCAAAAASCSSTSSDAATIKYSDGTVQHISKSDLLAQVKDLQANKDFRSFLQQNPQASSILSANPDAPSSKLTAIWLTAMVDQALYNEEFKTQGLQVTSNDTTAANNTVQQIFSPAGYKSFPKSFQNSLLTDYSRQSAVLSTCPSGRVVSHILLKTQAEAEAVFNQIASGGDFTKLAQQYSTDTGSKASGGMLGCLYPGEFVAPFQDAAEKDNFDTVTVPVKSQFGYHLILVRKWDPATAASDQTLTQSAQQAATCTHNAELNSVHVWINPQFGSWQQPPPNACGQNQQLATVAPPQAPNPRGQREKPPVTTTPGT